MLPFQNHFENEISSCRGFQSKVKEEAVALMPEAEFLALPQGQEFLQAQAERSKQQGEVMLHILYMTWPHDDVFVSRARSSSRHRRSAASSKVSCASPGPIRLFGGQTDGPFTQNDRDVRQ